MLRRILCPDCGVFVPHECSKARPGDMLGSAKEQAMKLLEQLSTMAPPSEIRILVVDDHKFIRDMLTNMLGRCSYTVTVVESGKLCLQLLAQPNSAIDLILADVMMPEMDGYQLLTEIRKNQAYNHIPVVMMSGIEGRNDILKCLANGADSYLLKPLRMEELKLLWQHVLSKKKEMAYRNLLMETMQEVDNLHNQLKQMQGRMSSLAKQESSMQLAITQQNALMSRAVQKAKRQGAQDLLNQASPDIVGKFGLTINPFNIRFPDVHLDKGTMSNLFIQHPQEEKLEPHPLLIEPNYERLSETARIVQGTQQYRPAITDGREHGSQERTDKVAVAASSSPSAAKPPEPGCIVCRICDQKIPEPEFDRHCETCHVLSAWVLQLDICDKNLGKVVTRIDSIAASIQAEVGVSAGITEEGAEQKPSRGDLVPIAYSMNKLLKNVQNVDRYSQMSLHSCRDILQRIQDIIFSIPDELFDASINKIYKKIERLIKDKMYALTQFHNALITLSGQDESAIGADGKLPHLECKAVIPTLDEFEVIKTISKGAYGYVVLCRKITTGDLFAVKVMKKSENERMNENFVKERNIMILSDCPFICKLYYSLATKENFYLVMEYCNGGDCFSLLQTVGFLEEAHVRAYAAEMVITLGYIHSHGIVHRDIKPDNMLVAPDGHLRLTDFGLSRLELFDLHLGSMTGDAEDGVIGEHPEEPVGLRAHKWKRFSHVGTPDYLAPEILLKNAYGPSVDWWALGISIFELLVGIPPFEGKTNEAIYDNVIHRRIKWPRVPDEMSYNAKDLINKLLALSPAERLGSRGADEVQRHPFFDGVDWDNITTKAALYTPTLDDPTDTKYFEGRNAVFYSPLEVVESGNKLADLHLGGKVPTASNKPKRQVMDYRMYDPLADAEAEEDDEDDYIHKCFWNLNKINQGVLRAKREQAQQKQAQQQQQQLQARRQ